jgi:hypothetical protein
MTPDRLAEIVALVRSQQGRPRTYTPSERRLILAAARQMESEPQLSSDARVLVDEAFDLRMSGAGDNPSDAFDASDPTTVAGRDLGPGVEPPPPASGPGSAARRPNRFVVDSLDGILIGGQTVDAFLRARGLHPDDRQARADRPSEDAAESTPAVPDAEHPRRE